MTTFFGPSSFLRKCLVNLKVGVQFGCIVYCTFEYVGEFVLTSGPSMEPTIFSKDVLVSESITRRLNLIKKGDIVIAKSPVNPKKYVCKRVIGLSGDKICHAGRLITTVPKGHVWLEGDNSKNSTDSRMYGPVPQGLIKGRAICRIWPLWHVGMFTYNEKSFR